MVPYLKSHCMLLYSGFHLTSQVLQGTRTTRPCITGHPVDIPISIMLKYLKVSNNKIKQQQNWVIALI